MMLRPHPLLIMSIECDNVSPGPVYANKDLTQIMWIAI
jgi:hypothetical protein